MEATTLYLDAVSQIEKITGDNADAKKLHVIVLQNCANCFLKLKEYGEVVNHCTKALEIDPSAVKALYFRSQASAEAKETDEAITDIIAAIKLDPQNKTLRDHYAACKKTKAAKNASQRDAMKGMFSGGLYEEKATPQMKKVNALPKFNMENPQVFFDVTIGSEGDAEFEKGRVVFELFADHTPITAENFRALCTGEKEGVPSYKGNKFHRIIKGFMMQGGDTTMGNGTGGKSIYGEKFNDEGVWLPHTHKGVLSMANAGPNTNGSQFFMCYGPTPHLDGKHTVYGRIIHGFEMCQKAEDGKMAEGDVPLSPVTIADCGELTADDKITEEDADFLASYA